MSKYGSGSGGEVGESGENGRVPAGTALVAAQWIFALATESFFSDLSIPDGSAVYGRLVFNARRK